MKKFKILLFVFLILPFTIFAETEIVKSDEEIQSEFNNWLNNFKKEVHEKHNIKKEILDKAFKDVKYTKKIVNLDRKQPEFRKTFFDYYNDATFPTRVRAGKKTMEENAKILKEVEFKYKIPPYLIVALWGVETDYGRNMGRTQTINSLTTLSYDNRRGEFFKRELIETLKLLQNGHLKMEDMYGSWAGAIGNFQFMPTTYTAYAVDGDGDGKIDLKNNKKDAIHSAANYLRQMKWDEKYTWGRPVSFDTKSKNAKILFNLIEKKDKKKLSYFSKLGVKKYNGSKLPQVDIKAQLIAPNGKDGPFFLVYDNFKYIKRWNNSTNYAVSVGMLSDILNPKKEEIKLKKP